MVDALAPTLSLLQPTIVILSVSVKNFCVTVNQLSISKTSLYHIALCVSQDAVAVNPVLFPLSSIYLSSRKHANPVPVALAGGPAGTRLRDGGILGDLAPTVLELMALPQPEEMTGRSLLVRANE